ncbi:unnamed protein product [Nezara viridula]|uniref:PHD and RING finger domain-containing protein 1 n=1 Tax=Nezara viridula TaxID=85310 RepID=A0A9P0MU25_NEZVI|nr:unnamed protein product [Nezara viridula]
MLSDSSNSDGSPIKNQRKKYLKESSDSEEENDNISKRKTVRRRRVSSSSESSGSGIVGPSHKKTRVISESESESCTSSDSEIDEVFRPWTSKKKLPKSRTALRSDSEHSSEEYTSHDKESKIKNEDQSSDSDEGEKCIICFKAFHGVIAHPSGCSHNFHSECLLTWSKTSNTCPIDRVKYTEVIVTGFNGEVVRHNVVTPPPQDHNNDIEPDDTTFCEVCNQHDREHEMLLCDRCEAGYHLDCLNPPLDEVPIGDWYCPDCSSLQNVNHSFKLVSSKESGATDNFRTNLNDVKSLDLFGSRPQLEYFSGCEAEDELDEEGSGGLGLLRSRTSGIRSMAGRKQIAAQILRSAPRRPVPRVGLATAPPDLLSSILNEQQKWLSPNAVIQSNSNGEVKVTLHNQADNIRVKKNVGNEEKTANGTNNQNCQKEENTSQSCGDSSESVPPLPPPPPPVFSRAYDDEDFDLYADIEAPVDPPLAPPPEPPALLLALEGDDAASSPEDAMLVIDDRQTYDPDVPTSPPPSPEAPLKETVETTDHISAVNIDIKIPPPRIPSPSNEDDIDDCPNRVMYSEASVNIARETKSDSESDSDKEPDVVNSNILPNDEIDTEKKKEDSESVSDVDINIMDDDKDVKVAPEEKLPEDETKLQKDVEDTENNDASDKTSLNDIDDNSKYDPLMSDDDVLTEEPKVKDQSFKIQKSEEQISTESFSEDNSIPESKKQTDSESEDNIDLEKISEEDSPIKKHSTGDSSLEGIKPISNDENEEVNTVEMNSENGETNHINDADKMRRELEWSRESTPDKKITSDKDVDHEGEDVLELGCGDDERDGLVDITDEEISTYEKSWELEDNQAPPDKTVGLEGLETEAISDCEYNIAEDGQVASRISTENGPKEEEGEIISEERRLPVAWKKISKSTKERSYREKDVTTFKEKTKKKEKKPKEKRKELERYDVRKIISDKPKKRKVDEFGRDISPSRSRSISESKSRSLSRRRSRSRSKKRRSRDRKSRNRSRGRSRGRSRAKSRDRSRKRSRGRSKSRSRSDSRRRRSRSPRKNKERRSRAKSKEKKRRKRDSSISCSSCSCSSCEQERRKSKKLTVIVPNKPLTGPAAKEKKKGKYKDRVDLKRRRDSPVPSKEVFTSGDNILVSVNFKSSKSGEASRKEPSKKKKDEESKKKKDKSAKENQPLRSIVSKSSSNQPSQKKSRINAKNLKPVAIIDLAQSPFREQTLSPKEIIVLTDSDSDDKRKPDENNLPPCQVTGPKTPPEPHIKFNIISSKPQMLRSLANPLLDSSDQLDADADEEDDDRVEIPHKGPNTPPEPPVPYDPFEPTKSRSPTPLQELEESRNPTPPTEKNLPLEPPQRPASPPKPLPESPKTPSPLHSPQPKPPEESTPEKANISPPNNCNDDSMDMGGGDSPYSPGSSEADDLFDAPVSQMNSSTPIAKVKPRQLQQKHSQKLTPSPLKRKPTSNKASTPLKNSKGNNKKETVGLKLDEDQLKILDDLPNSAVEMQVKDKFLKKLNRQERVVEEVKMVLKPHYAKKHVTKEEYKEILRKSVPKICHSRSGEINPMKIQRLIEAYVKKYRHLKKKRKAPTFSAPESLQPLKPKPKQTMWC